MFKIYGINVINILKFLIFVICIGSFYLNFYLIKQKYSTSNEVFINGETIQHPTSVISIQPKYTVKKTKINRPEIQTQTTYDNSYVQNPTGNTISSGNISDHQCNYRSWLEMVESATPNIQTEEIKIVEDKDGNFSISKQIYGSMQLSYLNYNMSINLNSKILKYKNNDFPVYALFYTYYSDEGFNNSIGISSSFSVPFTKIELFGGVGLNSIPIGVGIKLTKNSDIQVGLAYSYSGKFFPFTGINFRF